MEFPHNEEEVLPQQRLGIRWQRSGDHIEFGQIQVDVCQREQNGENKERRAVQEQVIAPQQPGEDSRPQTAQLTMTWTPRSNYRSGTYLANQAIVALYENR